MPKTQTESLRLISLLLQYPDEELLGRLDQLAWLAGRSCASEIRRVILGFLKNLGALAPIQAQERYTAVFDMNPATTLNVTYHICGDNERRAAVLARLQHQYDRAGWERITGELPDYLPLMLEFLAICPRPEHTAPIWQCLQGMQPLVEGLEKIAPAYAYLLQPIARLAVDQGEPAFEA